MSARPSTTTAMGIMVMTTTMIIMITTTTGMTTTATIISTMGITTTGMSMTKIAATTMITPTTSTTATTIPTAAQNPVADTGRGALGALPLHIWFSPAFPVGAFAYSHGLEWACEAGDVTDFASLEAWLVDLLEAGGPRNDAILFAEGHRASSAADWPRLTATNALALALANCVERRLETVAQGDAFVAAASLAWACPALDELARHKPEPVAYPIAIAAACAGHGLDLDASLCAFVLSLVANLTSAAVRLSAIGQSDGQRALRALTPKIIALARDAADSTLDDLGSAALRSDIAAMKHETQYSRLFRS